MSRQHATPLIVPAVGDAVALAALGPEAHGWSEAAVQALVQAHPACLPIREIDPLFANPVPLCTEMSTGAGPIDNVMITASGLPVLVECKLWRNPQARREVVGQILDYAKELSRWTASDLQREVSRRTGRTGNAVVELVREAGHPVDEIGFTDAVTLNLRRGRFLLLIVGDGIREGVEAIAEYLQGQSGLQFTLGLVEMPIFAMPDGARLVTPRVVARTTNITRTLILAPEGAKVLDAEDSVERSDEITGADAYRAGLLWTFVDGLRFTDPEQRLPKVTPKGYCYIYLPAPASSCWIAVQVQPDRIGLSVTSNTGTVGEKALQTIAEDWSTVQAELGGDVSLRFVNGSRPVIEEYIPSPPTKAEAVEWLRTRANDFVNALRPRVRAVAEDLS